MKEEGSEYWVFLTTFRPNIEWENIGITEFDLEEGCVRLLDDQDSHGRRLFLVGTTYPREAGESDDDQSTGEAAADATEDVIRYFIGFIYLTGGGLKINHDLHQHRQVTAEGYEALTELGQGKGEVGQFFDELDLIPPRNFERRVVYAADRFAQEYLKRFQPMMMKFLHNDRVPNDCKEHVKTVLGLSYNAKLAGTERQQFISEYTAVDLTVKKLGKEGSTDESLLSMKDNLVEGDVIGKSDAENLVDAIDHFHDVRTGVYFGGKKPSDYDTLPGGLVLMPGRLLGNLLFYYIKYRGKEAENSE